MSAHSAENVAPSWLAKWLLDHYAAEEERGYGHICAEDLAELLLQHFEMKPIGNDGGQADG